MRRAGRRLLGLVGGAALLLGALIAWFVPVPARLVAGVMAFGSGVLISATSFDLIDEAQAVGGIVPTTLGALAGACAYVLANVLLARAAPGSASAPGPSSRPSRTSPARALRSRSVRSWTGSPNRWCSAWDWWPAAA